MINVGAKPKIDRMGVAAVDYEVSSWGWSYRSQEIEDYGIDGHIEPFDETDRPTGRLLAVQVKSGSSYFERTSGGWNFRADKPRKKKDVKREDKYLQYWLGHILPVLIVMYHPDSKALCWQHVTEDRIEFTDRAWKIFIPEDHVLNRDAVSHLRRIAESVASATEDPLTASIPLLPPSAATGLRHAYQTAPAGAMRLARMLAHGRMQPELTAQTALAARPSWLASGDGQFEAAIGAYANDHGYPSLALDAFIQAGEYGSPDAARLFSIAALLALVVSKPDTAQDLVRRAEDCGGGGVLLQVARAAIADHAAGDDDTTGVHDVLARLSRKELDAEPTCLVFLGQLAGQRGDFAAAIGWFDAALAIRPEMHGAQLGKAQALIAKIGSGRSAVSFRDRTTARDLAAHALTDMRSWSGPSEYALAVLLTTHMLTGAFATILTLATPRSLGGDADDREASFGPVAITGAQAALALQDRTRAASFADLVSDTDAATFIRALALDPDLPVGQQATVWRDALIASTQPAQQRRALYQLAVLGRLTPGDLASPHVASFVDATQQEILSARNDVAQGQFQQAVLVLRRHTGTSPAASEMLIEVLTLAGRIDDALAECDRSISRFGADKIAHDKLNLLVRASRLPDAHAFAAQLLAGVDLAPELRLQLRKRLIAHSHATNDWATAEQQLRDAYAAHPDQVEFAWGLIAAQANQGRLDTAWATLQDLAPELDNPQSVGLWIDLHARFGFTEHDIEVALDTAARWPATASTVFTTLLAVGEQQRPDGGPVLPELRPDLLDRFQRDLADFVEAHPTGPIRRVQGGIADVLASIRRNLVVLC